LASVIGLTHLLELFSALSLAIVLIVLALPSVWRMELSVSSQGTPTIL